MENTTLAKVEEAYGIKIIPELYGNGHINKTYVTESRPRLIVQEITHRAIHEIPCLPCEREGGTA